MIKLKNILNEIVTEARRRRVGSGTIDWAFDVDGLHVPGICLPKDTLKIAVVIDYNYTGGTPERGMFGPPGDASPAEGPEVEMLGHQVEEIVLHSSNGQEREIYYRFLIPQQQEIIDKAIDESILNDEQEIDEAIVNREEG